jgi:hypothetical protein
MATLYETDGTATKVSPKGDKFTLVEAQALVGGCVEKIRTQGGFMLVNGDGVLDGLPLNMAASGKVGFDLVGDVLECTYGEF